jgi:hypothetical protein
MKVVTQTDVGLNVTVFDIVVGADTVGRDDRAAWTRSGRFFYAEIVREAYQLIPKSEFARNAHEFS